MATTTLTVTTTAPGNFTVAHNLGYNPTAVVIIMQTAGSIWFQTVRYDSTNLYLVASDSGQTATINVYADSNSCSNPVALSMAAPFTSTSLDSFAVPHGLGTTPDTVILQVLNAGAAWLSNPPFDQVNVYIETSDIGVTGLAQSFSSTYAPMIF